MSQDRNLVPQQRKAKLEQPQIRELKEDFDIWYKTPTESFLYINERSRVFPRWLSYQEVIKDAKYTNSTLKPINMYAKFLYPGPKLMDITDNIITLQQGNHAEIFLLEDEKEFYNIDRPWIRQYYLSNASHTISKNCFPGIFRFYVPWLIDANVTVEVIQADNSPFHIYNRFIDFKKLDKDIHRIDPEFIDFSFKNYGSHMIEPGFAKIPRQSPMFNLKFKASDIMVNEIKEYYEHN